MTSPGRGTRSVHVPEIDWLKGVAILFVICIHARVYEDTLFQEHVINRAVPIFLLLFGITSELSWQASEQRPVAERLKRWYESRYSRLYPAWWAMSGAWWAALVLVGRARPSPSKVLATFAGYAPWIGTSWFVTIILQLVLLFPALRWLFLRVRPIVTLSVTAMICGACAWYTFEIIDLGMKIIGKSVPPPGWYYAWIFVPRTFWNVAGGFFIARYAKGRPGASLVATAAALTIAGVIAVAENATADDALIRGLRRQVLLYLFDVPLAVTLLGAMRALTPLGGLTRFLTWCGLSSWGLYLGHTLVFEVLQALGAAPEAGPQTVRIAYAGFLFACGAVLTVGADRARSLARARTQEKGAVP